MRNVLAYLGSVALAFFLFGCSNNPTSSLTEQDKKNFDGGGNVATNGTASNPSGTTKIIPASDITASEATTATANTALENTMASVSSSGNVMDINVTSANLAYKQAIDVNPNNTQAQFGAAATELMTTAQVSTFQSFSDSIIGKERGLFKVPGVPMKISAGKIKSSQEILTMLANVDPKNAPKISQLQQAVKDSVLPKITYALDRLSIIENDKAFSFKLTPKMLGESSGDTMEIDLGEIYMIDASLRILRGTLLTLISYNVDVDINGSYSFADSLDDDSLLCVQMKRLHQTPSFLTLNSWGRDAMKSAIGNYRTSVAKVESALVFIKAEKDDQIDDVIKTDDVNEIDSDLGTQTEFSVKSISQALDTVMAVLNGPYTFAYRNINYPMDKPIPETTNVSIKLNVSAIFDNPITDLKTKLPYFKWLPNDKWKTLSDTSAYNYELNKDTTGDYTMEFDTITYRSNMVYTPGIGEYDKVYQYDFNPIEFTTASGTVISDSLLDANGPDFPDYTFGGLFPDLTNKQAWTKLLNDVSGPTTKDVTITQVPKVRAKLNSLGFTLAKGLR